MYTYTYLDGGADAAIHVHGLLDLLDGDFAGACLVLHAPSGATDLEFTLGRALHLM
jgi:hypothetical protein